ncbi:restriction endonuclease subunit S [uncultured Sunxiuqinia sp.]|uniref:restriction endonuclease subunit S n=1 Tax=uncultured Sunxiuqinia sp. TaxID=1573825 RepID=UPI002630A872|nr:restriction endonuclease subunit S [uncultured Sunxiuqinia sp.]
MSEWEYYNWGDLVELKYGKSLKDYREKTQGYRVFGTNGPIGYNEEFLYNKPSIIIGRKGAYRGVEFSKEPFFVIDTAFYTVNKVDFLDEKFGYYQLLTKNINALDSGSAIPSTSRDDFYSLEAYLPSKEEQIEIRNILDTLNKKITLLRQQNQNLEELAKILFKRWFVEFEFPNENGEPYKSSGGKMIESELGEIPEGWRVGCLNDEFTILMGQSPAGSSYNEIKEGKIFYQGRTDFGFRFPTNRLYTTEPKRIADKFDVLVSVRAPVGDVNMASEECCIGRGLGAVKSDLKSYCFNKIKSMKKAFDVFENEGTVFGSLSKNDFNSLEVIIPEKHVAEQYEQVAFKLDLKIFENSNEIQTLTLLRDTLLPKLMSGEIRVKIE